MIAAEQPHDETDRLAAVRSYGLLDADPQPNFDELTARAAMIAGTPIAIITLVAENRQWFVSAHGLAARETSREVAFCAHAILEPRPFVVPDAGLDARFHDNPLVTGAPHIRSYAGFPLVGPDGHGLGTLCVIDTEPRRLDVAQLEALSELSGHVVDEMRRHRVDHQRPDTATAASARLAAAPHPSHDQVWGRAEGMRPLPLSVVELAEATVEGKVPTSALISIVASDPELTRSIQRRAALGFDDDDSTNAVSVAEAVTRLGPAVTLCTVTADAVAHRLKAALPSYRLDHGDLLTHAMTTAAVAEAIRSAVPDRLDPGVTTAALLHHIGHLLLDENLEPGDLCRHLAHGTPLATAERETTDLDHAEVGATLLWMWGLPDSIVDAVRRHHEQGPATPLEAHAVALASYLATRAPASASSLDPAWMSSIDYLGLAPEQLADIVATTSRSGRSGARR